MDEDEKEMLEEARKRLSMTGPRKRCRRISNSKPGSSHQKIWQKPDYLNGPQFEKMEATFVVDEK